MSKMHLGFFTFTLLTWLGCSSILSKDKNTSFNSTVPKALEHPTLWKLVPKGSFTMGSPLREKYRDRNERQRKVKISRPFEIMATEITQMQWLSVMGSNPSHFKKPEHCRSDHTTINGEELCPNNPVEKVSWNDVQQFIKKLNEVQNLAGCQGKPSDSKGCYRLPTEAEWEYAARAQTQTIYSFGNRPEELSEYAWYADNALAGTHPVGLKKANPYGLYDIHGNVWEWVQDQYSKSPRGRRDPLSTRPGSKRVIRGGSWVSHIQSLRSANRLNDKQNSRFFNVGFRLVRQQQE